jgi:predicted negative regulator of RcsB-dependent stress response
VAEALLGAIASVILAAGGWFLWVWWNDELQPS